MSLLTYLRSIRYRGFLIAMVPLICSAFFIIWFCVQLYSVQQTLSTSGLTREIYNATQALQLDGMKGVYEINANISPDGIPDNSDIAIVRNRLKKQAAHLVSLCSTVPELSVLAKEVDASMDRLFELVTQLQKEASHGGNYYSKVDEKYYDVSTKRLLDFFEACTKLLEANPRVDENVQGFLNVSYSKLDHALMIAAAVCLITSAFLASWFARSIRAPLLHAEQNSLRLAQRKPLLPALTAEDEIGELDRFIHAMSASAAESIKREEDLIANATDFICSIDRQDMILSTNPACTQITGLSSSQIQNTCILDLVEMEDVARASELLPKIGSDKPVLFELKMKNSATAIDSQWSAIRSESESTVFCVIRDISEEKQIKQLKEDFFNMIGHDLRSPLTSLRCSIDLVKMGAVGEVQEPVDAELMHAGRNTQLLIALVNDLLDFEKLSSGKMTLEISHTDMRQIVEDTIEMVAPLAAAKDVKLEFDGANAACAIDKEKIMQVLTNLLTNAIKFTDENTAVIVRVESLNSGIRVSVIDRGSGVPPEFRESIFEPFVQLPGEKRGTGLGLSICKMIVTAHNGALGVRAADSTASPSGLGSCFWFELPSIIVDETVAPG